MAGDSLLPRDRMVNVLHFDRPVALPADPDGICEAIAEHYRDNWSTAAREIRCKLYEVGAAPNEPFGEFVVNEGVAPVSLGPREVALCLSFYADQNTPRRRGRIYLPAVMGGDIGAARPASAIRTKASNFALGLAGIGGVDIDWGVRGLDGFFRATIAYVDDEWDTQRRRGLRPTDRTLTAVSG